MTETPDQLNVLCETPLKVKIGEKEFKVQPLTLAKMIILRKPLSAMFEKITGIGELTKESLTDKTFLNAILDKLPLVIDDIVEILQVILKAKSNDPDVIDAEFLKENVDTVILGNILGFIVSTANVGQTIKNVVILRGMAK